MWASVAGKSLLEVARRPMAGATIIGLPLVMMVVFGLALPAERAAPDAPEGNALGQDAQGATPSLDLETLVQEPAAVISQPAEPVQPVKPSHPVQPSEPAHVDDEPVQDDRWDWSSWRQDRDARSGRWGWN